MKIFHNTRHAEHEGRQETALQAVGDFAPQALASLGLPTVFTMEGGYAVAEVGINTVNVLEGFIRA